MTKKDVKIYIGNTADTTKNNPTPCGISSFTPYIMWEIPNDVSQVRFNIKITNISTGAYLLGAETLGDANQFQWPLGLAMNNNWLGLCHIEIVFSDNNKIGTEMSYTSGDSSGDYGFFVLDDTIELLSSQSSVSYLWEKSIDLNSDQSLLYHLQVSTNPLFLNDTILINDTRISGITSGYVVYTGSQLNEGVYFYKVRAYDGYDYSDWSKIHCFMIKTYEAPVLTNLIAKDTGNDNGDFIINFDLYNSGADYTTVIIQYAQQDDISNKKPCALMNSTHLLPNGNNTVTWRTSEDITKISDNFWIYAKPYSNDMYGEEKMVLVYIDNERFSEEDSGVSSITISFINSFYMAYKRTSSISENIYPLNYYVTDKMTPFNYIGWNSGIWDYIHSDNNLINVNNTDDFQYYINFRNIYLKDEDKFSIENSVFNNVKYDDIKDFSVYIDGRSFLQNDKGDYIIYNSNSSVDKDEIISGGSIGTGNLEKITIRPSYQKPPAYNPKFVETAPDVKTNENIVNPLYSVYNYVEYKTDDDGKNRLYYYYRWGGELKGDVGYYNGSSNIINGYGKRTYIDGECVFEDNETESPEYTLYPNIICKNGYPPFIDERYWSFINLNDLYIRKYNLIKGHALPGDYGYKNFVTEKIEGKFHRFFSDKKIPLEFNIKDNKIYDENNNLMYIDNIKVTNLFEELPINISLIDDCFIDENNNKLYFQEYNRKYINIRGSIPTVEYSEEDPNELIINGKGFSNVAVPTYEKALNVICSSNNFNGRKSSFDIDTQITRDKRRYILGHYYDWNNRITDNEILNVLNDWFFKNYPEFNKAEKSSRLFVYRYKYLLNGEINEKKCIYVPIEKNGEIDYFWFEDNSNIFNVDWSSIDNNDYVSIVRDNISPYIVGANSVELNVNYNATFEGSQLNYELIKKKNYYSDKSVYGISDITITGDISNLFFEYYSSKSDQSFISTPKKIILDDKNIILETLSLYYFLGETKIIIGNSNYKFTQSNSGYNASIILYQNQEYYEKEIYYQYQYYTVSDEITEKFIKSNNIVFSDTNSNIIIQQSDIIQNEFKLSINENEIDPRYYNIEEKDNISYITLNYYMLNRNILISYNYYLESDFIDNSFNFSNDYSYKIDDNIIENTLIANYVDNDNYYHEIKYNDSDYSIDESTVLLNLNNSNYSKAINKPLQINYNIENISTDIATINFNNIYGIIEDSQIDVSTINLFYLDSDNEKVIIDNELYKILSNNIEIINPSEYLGSYIDNITLSLKNISEYLIQNMLKNKLYIEYVNLYGTQQQDFLFSIDSIFITNSTILEFNLYQNGLAISKQFYKLKNGYINFNIENGIYLYTDFLFKDLELRYSYREITNITKRTQDNILLFNNIDDSIQLNNNIDEIYFYYINDNHEIINIDDSLFDLTNKINGIIKLNSSSSDLIGKNILIDYSYNNYHTLSINKNIIFTNENEKIILDKNIISSITYYLIEEKEFVFNFNEENDYFSYTDINAYDFELSYLNNDTIVYINNYDYSVDNLNQKIILDNESYFNIDIKITYKVKTNLLSDNFEINENEINLTTIGLNNNLLNENIYVSYVYYNYIELIKKTNLIFNEFNSFSFLINEDFIFDSLKIYYEDILFNVLDFCTFDQSTGILTIVDNDKKDFLLEKTIQCNYKTYLENNLFSEIIKFNNYGNKINLSKTNIITESISFSFEENIDNEIYNILDASDFSVQSDNIESLIQLSNRFINQSLDISYKYYIENNENELIENINTTTFTLNKYPINLDGIKLRYLAFNDTYYTISKDDYIISDTDSEIQITFINNFDIYSGKNIIISYISYIVSDTIEQNNIFNNIMFYDLSTTYTINNGNVLSDTLKIFYLNNNEYEEVDLSYFNVLFNEENVLIKLNKNKSLNFILNNPIKIVYQYKIISDIKEYNFINDRSLIFSSLSKYIELSNSYIDKDTFNMYYYDSNNNKIFVSKDYYILWEGNDFTFGNVRLNKNNNNSKDLLGKKLEISYKYLENVKKIYGENNEKFPYLDFSPYYINNNERKDYYSAYPHSEHIGYLMRKDAIWSGDRGFGLSLSFTDSYEFEELQFVYLQQFWDAYNTIHWQGNLGSTVKIHLQYGLVNSKGIVNDNDWHDFISENSEFNENLYLNLIPPLTWDVYVNTFDDSIFLQNVIYMLRLRLYDVKTKTFTSEFINSNKFVIDHDSVNPVNIMNIKYSAWTSVLTIQFRIDDTQGDLYDLTNIYYSQDGRTWSSIDFNDVNGKKTYLTSNQKDQTNLIYHTIFWDTSNYNLTSGSNYRIKINTAYTKFNQGDEPYFTWVCTKNPEIDYYERKILEIEGGKQYYIYNENNFEKVINEDGTIEYVEVDNPVGTWDRVTPYEYTYQIETIDEYGNTVSETVTETRDYIIVNGTIKDNENKIQEIKDRPYKTVINNGVLETVAWGIKEYYNSSGVLINRSGYNNWMNGYDDVYNSKRIDLITNLNNQIDIDKTNLALYKKKRLECEIENRRSLIKQGYYNNGFENNTYDKDNPIPFKFMVIDSPSSGTVSTVDLSNDITDSYIVYYNFQMDFNSNYNSQGYNIPLRDEFYSYNEDSDYNERISGGKDVTNASHISISGESYSNADPSGDSNSNDNRYYGSYTMPKSKYPGKLSTDKLPTNYEDWSTEYFWRLRPYNLFIDDKKEISRSIITSIVEDGNNIKINFSGIGSSDLGTVSLLNWNNYGYVIYFSNINDNTIKLSNPSINDVSTTNYSGYTVEFPTDRIRDEFGYVIDNDNFKNWISFNPNKIRPICVIFNNDYYLYYYKPSIQGNKLIFCSLSKNGYEFGEYSQCYPYNPDEIVTDYCNYSQFLDPFVLRINNSFYMWTSAIEKTDFDGDKNVICFQSSDYTGDNWGSPITCNGLDNCYYSSIIYEEKERIINQITEKYNYYILCALKDNNFVFFNSDGDEKNWVNMNINLNKNNLKINDSNIDYDNINYGTPFLYRDNIESTKIYYLYFSVYDLLGNSSIYRTSSIDLTEWSDAELIINNAFNPSVVCDTYYGNNVQKLYYNSLVSDKLNGSDIQKIIVKTLVVTSKRVWSTLNNIISSSCDLSSIPTSNAGIENNISIRKSSIENYDLNNLKVRLVFLNTNNKKQYYRYGNWLNYENSETFGYSVNPDDKFKYLDI